jgi:pimeloyl-ACP methyl ester carboxylesterase
LEYEDKYVDVAGIRTRYWQAGHGGSDVVLIHGVASSVEDWEGNIAALAQDHRVFAVDLVGCGRSDKPASYDYSLPGLARFVLAFMSTQGIATAHLVGFSLGGQLALQCAHLAPERVRSLLLAAPAAIGLDTIINFRLASLRGVGELLTRPNPFGMKMLLRTAFADPSKVTSDMVEDRLVLARLPGAQTAFLTTLRGMLRFSGFHPELVAGIQSWLPSVACPALVIWGSQDRFLPPRHAEILRERLPNCTIKFYDNCGHLPQIEQREAFNRDAANFLGGAAGA